MKGFQRNVLLCLAFFVVSTAALATPETSKQTMNICFQQADGTVFPVISSCTNYIFCLNQNPVTMPCAMGMGFSQATGDCVNEALSDCVQELITLRACVDNERRPENQLACIMQPFGELVAYPGNCSQYLVCDCEYPTVRACPHGLWFNPEKHVCDWPQNVDCNNGVSTPTTTGSSTTTTPMTTTTTAETTTTTTATPILPCVPPPGVDSDLCDLYENGVLFSYAYNCNAYINCTNSCPLLNYCPPDKEFNARLQICDTPCAAQCTAEPLPTTSTELPTTTTTTNTELPVTTTTTTTQLPVTTTTTQVPEITTTTTTQLPVTTTTTTTQLPVTTTSTTTQLPETTTTTPHYCEPVLGIDADHYCNSTLPAIPFHPYPYNCTAYLFCDADCPRLSYCKPDKVFNALLGICDTPEAVACNELPYPTTTVPPTTETTTPSTTTNLPPGVDATVCRNVPSGTLLPYDGNCTQFIECLNGDVILRTCPSGWLFNPALLICDERDDVECYEPTTTAAPSTTTPALTTTTAKATTTTPTVTTTTTTTTMKTTTTTTVPSTTTPVISTTTPAPESNICNGERETYPYAENCRLYYYCFSNGTSSLLSCPNNNWYNPITGDCGPDVSPTACRQDADPATLCKNQPAGNSYALPSNCQQYVYCLGGSQHVILNCPNGAFYNPVTQNCGPNVSPTACQSTNLSVSRQLRSIPSTPPNICINSLDFTVYPNYGNCSQFVVCLHRQTYQLECLGGQFFDPVLQNCDSRATRSSCQGAKPQGICENAENGQLVPYPDRCNKYIVCAVPAPVAYSCTDGLLFSQSAQSCVQHESADCTGGNSSTDAPNDSTPTPTQPPNYICTDHAINALIPYPEDCGKYIICELPIAVGNNCGEGLEFNAALQECSVPDNANCSIPATTTTTVGTAATTISTTSTMGTAATTISTTPTVGTAATTISTTTTVGTAATTISTTTAKPLSCADLPNDATLPNTADCATYILCINGKPNKLRCFPNTYYNVKTGQCDSQTSSTACQESATTITVPVTTTTVIKPTTWPPTTGSTATTTTSSPAPPTGICVDKPVGSLQSYPQNCSKYIVCAQPIPVGYDCDDGLEFNAEVLECQPPDVANCSIHRTKVPSQICSDQPNGTTLPTGNDCTAFIVCENGLGIYHVCPVDTYYNPYLGVCVATPPSAACMVRTTAVPITTLGPASQNVCCGHAIGTRIPYPGDCSHFIICDFPVPSVLMCTKNTLFDGVLLQCVPAEAASCDDPPPTPTPPQTPPPNMPIRNASTGCRHMPSGTAVVFLGDCTRYNFCFGGVSYALLCPDSWFYHPELGQCVPTQLYECPW